MIGTRRPRRTHTSRDSPLDLRIGKVPAIPGQQVIDIVHGGHGNVGSIANRTGRDDPADRTLTPESGTRPRPLAPIGRG